MTTSGWAPMRAGRCRVPDRRAEHDRASGFGAAPKQFAGIVAPVLLALILVISFHPLIGILCRRGAPQSQCRRSSPWRAVTWDPARACGLTADGDESQLTTLFDVLQPGDPDFDVVLP